MKNKYQESFSLIRPSDESIERIMNMPKGENKKRIKIAPAVAVVACLAVLVAGIFGSGAIKDIINPKTIENPIVESNNAVSKIGPGFVMVAYADEQKDVKIVDDINNLEPSTPFICQIGAVDIKGKSQKEIDKITNDIREKYQHIEGENELGKVYYCMSTNTDIYDDAVIYEAYCGNFNFDINDDTVKNVKEIRVSNINKDYGYVEIRANDVYYNDDLTLKNDGINYDKSVYISNRFPEDKYASISGSRYQKCYAIGQKIGGVKKFFGINWKINDGLYAELNKNPNFDLTQIKDTITFEVEFNDGSIAKSVLNIAFTQDGKMYAVGGSYDFVDATKL